MEYVIGLSETLSATKLPAHYAIRSADVMARRTLDVRLASLRWPLAGSLSEVRRRPPTHGDTPLL